MTDLPVIATSYFPDFLPEQSVGVEVPLERAQLTADEVKKSVRIQRLGDKDMRTLSQLSTYRGCRQRAPQLVQIKCLQWLNSLDHGAV